MSWLYTIIFAGLTFSSNDGSMPMPVELPQNDVVVIEQAKGDETEKFEQTYPLNANGRVSVSNVNGSIKIEAWDRNEVKLTAVKTADSKERLAEVEIKVESRPDSFSVETNYDNWKRNNGGWKNHGRLEVDYQLMVPRGAVLNEIETVNGSVEASNFTNVTRISAVNGTVRATNIRGTARLCTVNGEVVADFDRLESGSKISLETVNGQVNLKIPSDSNATVKADSLNGNISNDFGLTVRKGKYVGRDLYGRLGSGDVQIKLSSVNGGLAIARKNDGKSLSPATNLLQQKSDDDWDNEDKEMSDKGEKWEKDAKAPKAPKTPKTPIIVETPRIDPVAIARTVESAALAAAAVNAADIEKNIRNAAINQAQVARAVTAGFNRNLPNIQTHGNSFAVSGVPTVTVNAEPCAVRVTGWDKNEVKYRVIQIVEPRRSEPLKITDMQTKSEVEITVEEPKANNGQRYYGDGVKTRVEVFVPRKSNLKINANREIRIEGVTGNVDLVGSDQPISVIDVDGKLKVQNSDGNIRVIGFRGEIDAETSDGSINLEGDFKRLKAISSDGTITLTLPENASADLIANCDEIHGDGISVTKLGGEEEVYKYRIGRGGAQFEINTAGAIMIRGAGLLSEIY